MTAVFVHIAFRIIAGAVILAGIAFVVIDMLGRIDVSKARAPWIEKALRKRSVFSALLVIAICLQIGTGYELLTRELPPIPEGPRVTIEAPKLPVIEEATSASSGRQNPRAKHESGSLPYYSNEQIKDSAMAFARRIRQLELEQKSQESTAESNLQRNIATEFQKQDEDIRSRVNARFGPLRAESKCLIFHLLNRVPAPQPSASEIAKTCLSAGQCAGRDAYEAVADYIDQLANLVPVEH